MDELIRRNGGLMGRDVRTVGRELSKLDGRGRLELAWIDQEADLQAERLSALAYVGKRAMQDIALLSQLEIQLSALVPAATPRLQGIGDMTALAMADVVSDTVRKVK
jgi:hypothetical protein